jgi:hypothetical protein
MSGTADATLAALAALAAACSFGVGVVLQHRQAQLAPTGGRAPFRLLAQLARQRCGWLASPSGGVALFLTVSPPSAGRSDAPTQDWVLAFAAVALVAAAAVTAARFPSAAARRRRRRRQRQSTPSTSIPYSDSTRTG